MWIPTWHPMDHVSQSLGLFSKTAFLEVSLTRNHETMALWRLTTVGLFYFIHANSIRLRAWSHMTSQYTWGSVTTLHGFGSALGRHLDTFCWALTPSWPRLLARVWGGPEYSSLLSSLVCNSKEHLASRNRRNNEVNECMYVYIYINIYIYIYVCVDMVVT